MPRSLVANSLVPLLMLNAALAPSAQAQWSQEPVVLNAAGRAAGPVFASADGAGGAIVVWRGNELRLREDDDLYAQRVTADGRIAPGWPREGLPVCVAPEVQTSWRIRTDGAGGAYIAWQDHRDVFGSRRVYLQRLTANGRLAPGWPVNGIPLGTAPGHQIAPQIATDGAGGVFVVWHDLRRDPGYPLFPFSQIDFYVQRISAEGQVAPGWPAEGLPLCVAPGIRLWLAVMPDGAGGLYAAWLDARPTRTGIYSLRLTAEGAVAPGWVEGGVPITTLRGGAEPQLAPDGEGGFLVAAGDRRLFASQDVAAQRITASGAVAPGWPPDGVLLCSAYEEQSGIGIVPDGAGGAIALWTDYRDYFPNASDIYGQRIRGDGTIAPGWPVDGAPFAAARGVFEFTGPSPPVSDGAGGVLLAFETLGAAGYRVFAQHMTGSGVPAPGWPADGVLVSMQHQGFNPVAVSDGAGGMLVAWEDGSGWVRLQRVAGECPTVPSLAVELTADPQALSPRARGRWLLVHLEPPLPYRLADLDLGSLRLNGVVPLDPAAPLQRTDLDRDGLEELALRFDRGQVLATALPGADGLVLRVTGKIGEQCLLGVTRVALAGSRAPLAQAGPALSAGAESAPSLAEPPPSDALAVSPQPARDSFRLRFYARHAGTASLALYDVAGRRVQARPLEAASPGWQAVQVELPSRLGAGIYFLRLDDSQGPRTQRVLLAR